MYSACSSESLVSVAPSLVEVEHGDHLVEVLRQRDDVGKP